MGVARQHDAERNRVSFLTVLPSRITIKFFEGNKTQGGGIWADHDDLIRVAFLQGFPKDSHFLPDWFRIGLDSSHAATFLHSPFEIYTASPVRKLKLDRHRCESIVPRVIQIPIVNELLGPLAQEVHIFNTAKGIINQANSLLGIAFVTGSLLFRLLFRAVEKLAFKTYRLEIASGPRSALKRTDSLSVFSKASTSSRRPGTGGLGEVGGVSRRCAVAA
jgi:hypothetical protein